jgi:hypothetical protein
MGRYVQLQMHLLKEAIDVLGIFRGLRVSLGGTI